MDRASDRSAHRAPSNTPQQPDPPQVVHRLPRRRAHSEEVETTSELTSDSIIRDSSEEQRPKVAAISRSQSFESLSIAPDEASSAVDDGDVQASALRFMRQARKGEFEFSSVPEYRGKRSDRSKPSFAALHGETRKVSQRVVTRRLQFAAKKTGRLNDIMLAKVPVKSLRMAIRNGNLDIARKLIESEIQNDPDWKNSLGIDLMWAMLCEQIGIASVLIEQGVNLRMSADFTCTPLLLAATMPGAEKLIATMITRQADVNATDRQWWTPLMYACNRGLEKTVRLLLKNNASLEQANAEGFTALGVAAHAGKVGIVRLLLRKGAKVDDATFNTRSAMIAAIYGGHLDIVKLLVEKGGASCMALEADGKTALAYALCRKKTSMEIIEYLARQMVDNYWHVDFRDFYPLSVAIRNGRNDAVKMFIEEGWSISHFCTNSLSPLLTAASCANNVALKMILESRQRPKVNDRDEKGKSALMAVLPDNLFGIYILLKNGADLHLADNDQKTPLLHALEAENVRSCVVDFLLYMTFSNEHDDWQRFRQTGLTDNIMHFLDKRASRKAGSVRPGSLDLGPQLPGQSGHLDSGARKFVRKLCLEHRLSHLAAVTLVTELEPMTHHWQQLSSACTAENLAIIQKRKQMLVMFIMERSILFNSLVAAPESIISMYHGSDAEIAEGLLPQPFNELVAFVAIGHIRQLLALGKNAIDTALYHMMLWLPDAANLSSVEMKQYLATSIGLHPIVIDCVYRAWNGNLPAPAQISSFAVNFLAQLKNAALEQDIAVLAEPELGFFMAQLDALRDYCRVIVEQ
jgi:ankyrin repeat protein